MLVYVELQELQVAVAVPIARLFDIPTSLCGETIHATTSRNTAVYVAPAMQQAAEEPGVAKP